jgi:hypothetical protein
MNAQQPSQPLTLSAHPKLWFFKLTQLSHLSLFKTSVLMISVMLLILFLSGIFALNSETGTFKHLNAIGSALFLSVLIPTAISLVVHVLRLSEGYLTELRPVLSCSDEVFAEFMYKVSHEKRRFLLLWGTIGLGIGAWLQRDNITALLSSKEQLPAYYYLMNLLALCLWSLMFQVFNTLTRNARMFGLIVRDHLEVNLLDLKGLSPCSKVAIVPVLLAVGLYVVYPLIWIGKPVNFSGLLFPILFTVPSLLMMFLLPLLPLKKKIHLQKERQVNALTRAINGDKTALKTTCLSGQNERITLLEMIQFRQYFEKLSEWGIDAPALKKVSLYIFLPPLTWVAAALVEQLITG